jgi:hypothetical protein
MPPHQSRRFTLIKRSGGKNCQMRKGTGEAIENFKKGLSEPTELDITPKKDEALDLKTEKKEVK